MHYNNMTNKQPYLKENLLKILKFYYKELNVSYKMLNFQTYLISMIFAQKQLKH